MNSVQNTKKKVYGLFDENFYLKKAIVEYIVDNRTRIRRPYRAKVKELSLYSQGIEGAYSLICGAGVFLWIGTGAFSMAKSARYQIPICVGMSIVLNIVCDLCKVNWLFPCYKETIEGVLTNYHFVEDERHKLIYNS